MVLVTDPVIKSYLDFLQAQRQARWEDIDEYRDYTDGDAVAQMTDDQKILLVGADASGNPNSNPEFNINVCGTIIDAEVDRLSVRDIHITIPDNDELSTAISKEVWRWWEKSGMDDGQQHSYFSAGRDGDSYPIVDYDAGYPRITLNMAYNGDSGTEVAYEDGHPNAPLYAVKRWTMQRPTVNNLSTHRTYRMNMYFNNRIEYYLSAGIASGMRESGWRRLIPGDRDYIDDLMQEAILQDPYGRDYTATVVWLTADGTPTGEPVGNPVKHLRHDSRGDAYGRSRIADVVPGLQDAINRSGVALQTATLLNGFKELVITKFYPTVDNDGVSNALKRMPGAIHYISDDASIFQTTETDLNQLIAVMDKFVILAATLTSTPLSLFNLTAQTPAEGTQKQLESALITSVENSQRSYGNTWKEVVRQQVKLDTLYNEESTIPIEMYSQIDEFDININWEKAESRNDLEEREIASIDIQQLGVPKEFVWESFWSAEEIARMKTLSSMQRNAIIGTLAARTMQLEQQPDEAVQDATDDTEDTTDTQ